jgi:hypothetical protein
MIGSTWPDDVEPVGAFEADLCPSGRALRRQHEAGRVALGS